MRHNGTTNQNKPEVLLGLVRALRKKVVARSILVACTLVLTAVLLFALTVAWQTNVIQSEGLTFTAQIWDFNGEIIIDAQAPSIAPGDVGVVSMHFSNNSELPAVAGISVSKAQMIEQMQNRLYFYVDDTAVRNGETIQRVYLNSTSSYTYAVFPHSELVLQPDNHNAPLLKWEWVYDVLGYYVRGTLNPSGGVTVSEYLRPVQYAYDAMKTTFDADGNLLTIDGSTTVRTFLAQLSETDGYAANIDYNGVTAAGYYPLEVDANGNGIWVYLCDRDEIEQAAQQDTALGTAGTVLGTARIDVMGQNDRNQGISVTDETSLQTALNGTGVRMIKLNTSLQLTQPLTVRDHATVMLDLNGNTLTSTAQNIIDAQPGSSVMLYNGIVEGGADSSVGVFADGAVVTMSQVTLSGVDEGIKVMDKNNAQGLDSHIHLIDCNIIARLDGLWVYGNGDASAENTVVIVENSNIEGTGYAGVIFNGTYYGNDTRIIGSTIKGKYAAVYYPPKDSTLLMQDCTLEGHTGLVVKGGTVDVVDCIITGTGVYNALPADPSSLSLSGWVDTGDGVYLEANYYNHTTVVRISGDKTRVIGTQSGTLAVRQFPDAATAPQASIVISGGQYNTDVSDYLADGSTVTQQDQVYTVS